MVDIHHVQLAMPEGEEKRAIEFYERLLRISHVPKPPHLAGRGGCWFESERVKIHLGVERNFRPARKAHPAFLVENLNRLRERLTEAGTDVVDDQPLPGFRRFYAYDPFGNRLEFLEAA